VRRIAATTALLALSLAALATRPLPSQAGIVLTDCSAEQDGLQFKFASSLFVGASSDWQLLLPSGLDYESSTFDSAQLKAGKVKFTDGAGIQLDGDPSGDQNVEAKLKGTLTGDADGFTMKLLLTDLTSGEKFKLRAEGSCSD
jgi:hypothetical protein